MKISKVDTERLSFRFVKSAGSVSLHEGYFLKEKVQLRFNNVLFRVDNDGIVVEMPVEQWEAIRTVPGIDLTYAGWTDEQILEEVTQVVDEHLARYEEAKKGEKPSALLLLKLRLGFDPAVTSREHIIADYITTTNKQRDLHNKIAAFIEEFNKESKVDNPNSYNAIDLE